MSTYMSTFAPVYNPADPNALLIFGVSQNSHLNLRTFNTATKDDITPPTSTSKLPKGIISVPCTLAGLVYREWNRIYGWLDIKDPQDPQSTEKFLYMLSPVHQEVFGVKSTYTGLAGLVDTSSGDKQIGYLYYLDGDEALWEQNLEGGDPTPVAPDQKIMKGTALSACYGPDNVRYLLYQGGSGSLQIWNATRKRTESPPDNANAVKRSPLAFIKYTSKDGKPTMNCYYVRDKDKVLMRSQRIGDDGDWVDKNLSQAGKPSASTTFSATWNEATKSVFLTYSLGTDTVCVRDKW